MQTAERPVARRRFLSVLRPVKSPKDASKKKPDIDDGGKNEYDAEQKSGGPKAEVESNGPANKSQDGTTQKDKSRPVEKVKISENIDQRKIDDNSETNTERIGGEPVSPETTPEAQPEAKQKPDDSLNEVKDNKRTELSGTAKEAKLAKARQGEDGPLVRDHFQEHGDQVGAKTAREYDLSSRRTIQNGRKFTYRDRMSGEPRVGYHDPKTGLFTATSQTRKTPAILS
jgi:hypothetical protein